MGFPELFSKVTSCNVIMGKKEEEEKECQVLVVFVNDFQKSGREKKREKEKNWENE